MKYTFNVITTLVIDSDLVNVDSEERAWELLEQGFGREEDSATMLAHISK